MQGRLTRIQSATLWLDRAVTLDAATSYSIFVETAAGLLELDLVAGQSGALTSVNLAAPNLQTIKRGSVFALAATSIAPRLMRVLSNRLTVSRDGGGRALTFSILAVEEDPNKFARIESGVDFGDLEPYTPVPLGPPDQVAALTAEIYWRSDPGSQSKLRALLAWPRGGDPRIVRWRVQLLEPRGRWADALPGGVVFTNSADILLPAGALVGDYGVRVRAETITGDFGPWRAISLDPAAAAVAPPPPNALISSGDGLGPGLESFTIRWLDVETPELRGYQVQWSTDANFGFFVGQRALTGTTLTIGNLDPSLTHYFRVRTVTHAEVSNVSDWVGPVSGKPLSQSEYVQARGGLVAEDLQQDLRDGIDAAIAVGDDVAGLDSRLTLVEGENGGQAAALSQLQTDVTDVDSRATILEGVVVDLETDLGAVSASVATNATAIAMSTAKFPPPTRCNWTSTAG